MLGSLGIRFSSKIILTFLGFFLLNSHLTKAQESFNAGDMIIHHITDAHEIHFMTFNEGQPDEWDLAIYLPIILYTDQGLKIFSSSHLYHNKNKVEVNGKEEEYFLYDGFAMFHEKIYYAGADESLAFDAEGHPTNPKPFDISITKTVAGIFLSLFVMLFLFVAAANGYKKRVGQAPKGLQSLLEPLIVFIRDEVAKPSIGHHYERFMPFLLTVFFFIWIGNLLGLIPFIGGFNITGNIAVTATLALLTFVITTVSGNKNYWVHIFNTPGVPWWLKFPVPLMPVIELIGVFSKPLVLCLRLFANMTAGHIIILSFMSLIFIFGSLYGTGAGFGVSLLSLAFAIFMNTLELLVAFLQAYVFTLLSALYFGAAVEEHHH